MTLSPPAPTDTRFLFRPVSAQLVALLRGLPPHDWQRPTLAGSWRVRDIVAHLVDLSFRRLSFHRDAMVPPPPPAPIDSERAFTDFINWLNAQWVTAATRFSPRVLTDLFDSASTQLADWFEAVPIDAPALFGVSWAGEMESEGWFDVGREFTELWHHQEQIRLAVGAPSLPDPRYLRAVLEIALRGLPHAFREAPGERGESVVVDVTGPSGGVWTLTREEEAWRLYTGEVQTPATRVRLTDQTAWRLLFNALPDVEARQSIEVLGSTDIAALLNARSIVI